MGLSSRYFKIFFILSLMFFMIKIIYTFKDLVLSDVHPIEYVIESLVETVRYKLFLQSECSILVAI